MATLSAHTDEATASRVSEMARLEDRTPSQITAAAVRWYVRLPVAARDALRRFEAQGDQAIDEAAWVAGRALLNHKSARKLSTGDWRATCPRFPPMRPEDDILAEAASASPRRRLKRAAGLPRICPGPERLVRRLHRPSPWTKGHGLYRLSPAEAVRSDSSIRRGRWRSWCRGVCLSGCGWCWREISAHLSQHDAEGLTELIASYAKEGPSLTLGGGVGVIPIHDAEDRHVLETAWAGGADILVTANLGDFVQDADELIQAGRIYRLSRGGRPMILDLTHIRYAGWLQRTGSPGQP